MRRADCGAVISEDEREQLWAHRAYCATLPAALPRLLSAVPLCDRCDARRCDEGGEGADALDRLAVADMRRLLPLCPPVPLTEALEVCATCCPCGIGLTCV
jgi:hypothetical protein